MRTPIQMPNLGYDMAPGKIAAWLKAPGDSIKRGEPIAEIETDKATIEMESVATGKLTEIVHHVGAEVPVGEVIAYIEEDE